MKTKQPEWVKFVSTMLNWYKLYNLLSRYSLTLSINVELTVLKARVYKGLDNSISILYFNKKRGGDRPDY